MSWDGYTVPNPPPNNSDTLNFKFRLPDYGGDPNTWGYGLNGNWYVIDIVLDTLRTTANAALPRAGGTMTGDVLFETSANCGTAAKPVTVLHASQFSIHAPGGSAVASCDASGNMVAVDYTVTSDSRLKDTIENMDCRVLYNGIRSIVPKSFRWISSGDIDEGLIAQDVQNHLPFAVERGPDGYLCISWPKILVALLGAFRYTESRRD